MSDAQTEKTAYELIGGEAKLRQIVGNFFDLMQSDPQFAGLRAMHSEDLTSIRQVMFEYLSGWMGGPSLYVERPNRNCINSIHRGYQIGEAERDAWTACMKKALEKSELKPAFVNALDMAFRNFAEGFRNR